MSLFPDDANASLVDDMAAIIRIPTTVRAAIIDITICFCAILYEMTIMFLISAATSTYMLALPPI
jgi:hypothetical protein